MPRDTATSISSPAGAATCSGHCPPRVVEAVREQVGRLIHVPNTWYMEPQGVLAQALVRAVVRRPVLLLQQRGRGQRSRHQAGAGPRSCSGRFKIVTMEGGFHGRTYARLIATAQPKYHEGFEPMVPGFVYVPFNDLETVAAALDEQTAAVLVEPIQGEGGINIPSPDYLPGLRQLCDDAAFC